jgi:hypothetical protein
LFSNQGIGITSWEEVKGHGPNNNELHLWTTNQLEDLYKMAKAFNHLASSSSL